VRQRRLVWVLRRIGLGVLTLLFVSIVVFSATQALPGDPAHAILGRYATPALVRQLDLQLHLNRPLYVQYWDWLSGVVQGNFGQSLAARAPVSSLLGPRIVNSLVLLLYVGAITIPLSISIGTWGAVRRDRIGDRVTQATFISVMALPDFVVATACVILLATTVLSVLPAVSILSPGQSAFTAFSDIALPVLSLLIISVPFQSRLVRASMIEALESEYVQMARLRGVPERRVIWRHALPNALVPAVQSMALTLSYLLGGVVIIEFVFNYPGLGGLLDESIGNRDLPVIQAVTLIFTAGVVLFNLTADILTVYLTPKLRTAGGPR